MGEWVTVLILWCVAVLLVIIGVDAYLNAATSIHQIYAVSILIGAIVAYGFGGVVYALLRLGEINKNLIIAIDYIKEREQQAKK